MYAMSTVTSDFIGFAVCALILYGTLFETKIRDNRRSALVYLVAVVMLIMATEIVGAFVPKSSPVPLIYFFATITVAGSYLSMSFMLNYLYLVTLAKGVELGWFYKVIIVFNLAMVAVTTILIWIGDVVSVDPVANTYTYEPGYLLMSMMMYAMYVVVIVTLIVNSRKIGNRDCIIFLFYLMFPIIMGIVGSLFPRLYLGYSPSALSILLIYVMLQSRLFDITEETTNSYFRTMAYMYNTMHILDLEEQTAIELTANYVVHGYVETHPDSSVQEIINGIISARIIEAHKSQGLSFVDLSTLKERLEENDFVSMELLNVENHWMRFVFIRVGDEYDDVRKVILSCQDIDDDKRKEAQLILMSNTDELTQLFNRHAYETDMAAYDEAGVPDDLWYMNFDLNDLKIANDSYGHAAGDELLRGMAHCLSKAVSGKGKAYRIGGDEFVVMMRGSKPEADQVVASLVGLSMSWRGEFNEKLSFAKGIVCSADYAKPRMADLEKEADRRMYHEKRDYHMTSGVDRRRR